MWGEGRVLRARSPQGQLAQGLLSVGSITRKMGSLLWEKAVDRGTATVSLQRCWVLLTGKKWGLSVVCWGDSRGEASPQAALCSPLPHPTCPAVCQRDTIRVRLEMPAKPTLTWPQGADGSQLCFRSRGGLVGLKFTSCKATAPTPSLLLHQVSLVPLM